MGLSSMPSPSDGVLTVILVNTVISLSMLKGIAQSMMRVIGLQSPREIDQDFADEQLAGTVCYGEPSLTDRFRSRFKPVQFSAAVTGRRSRTADCRVCLNRFEPQSEVDKLPCGHVFHKACLDRWLDYHHATCPLCRTYLLPADDHPVAAAVATVSWL